MTISADSIVLVTGASSGIGLATAMALGKRSCRLSLVARRTDKIRKLAQDLQNQGVDVLEIGCDIRDPEQARNAIETTVAHWGRLDILINNAGILEWKHFPQQSLSSIEDMMKTNYFGAVYTTHAALHHMLRRRRGHILNVASVVGLIGVPQMAAYSASKFALVGLTESLRRELYGTGVTLTAMCPGVVYTPMTSEIIKDPRIPKLLGKIISLGYKSPEQVAAKILKAIERSTPEVIYGLVPGGFPGGFVHWSKFFPRLSDWIFYMAFRMLDDKSAQE